MSRGGRRAGAGRKPSPAGKKRTVSLWITEELSRFLDSFGPSKSAQAEAIVRKAKAFRDWSRNVRKP